MIPLRDQAAIRERFSKDLNGTVKIDLFTRRPSPVFIPGREECPSCPEVETIVREVAALSPKITLQEHELGQDRALEGRYGVEGAPTTVVRGAVNRPLLFRGRATGSLFPVLIEAIVDVSLPAMKPPPDLARRLNKLRRSVLLQVFVAPDALSCAEQARIAQVISLSSRLVRSETIEALEFPALCERLGVTAVPTTVIDRAHLIPGAFAPDALIEAALTASATPAGRSVLGPRVVATGDRETLTPLPMQREAAHERPAGQPRPSGLIIPGR